MQIPRRTIDSSLTQKGFVKEQKDHTYYYHEHEGRRTGAFAKVSHGSKFKDYGPALISSLKRELRLQTNKQAYDLLTCPMGREEYERILRGNGTI